MPAPVIAYLHMYDAWWTVTAAQWPHVVAAGMRPAWNLDDVATRVKRRPARVHAYTDGDGRTHYSASVPIYRPLDFRPDDWQYIDEETQRRLGVW